MSDRNLWSNQLTNQTTETPSAAMRLTRRNCQVRPFELALGQVRFDLSARDLMKLKSLLEQSANVYLDDLKDSDA